MKPVLVITTDYNNAMLEKFKHELHEAGIENDYYIIHMNSTYAKIGVQLLNGTEENYEALKLAIE